jgi:small subunit ribosomal protein S17
VSERKAKAASPKASAPKAAAAKAAAPKAAAPKAGVSKSAAPKAAAAKAAANKVAATAASDAARANLSEGISAPVAEGASFKRVLVGRVKSDKMNKTIVVEVVRSKLDPVYKKYVRVTKRYQAHDEENAYRIGDRVEIIEHRPLSKMKRWKVINLVERAVQE